MTQANIRIVQHGDWVNGWFLDYLVTPMHQLDTDDELQTAVICALCTDRRAADDELLPDPRSDDRRGCWADTNAEAIWDAWPWGSRLWLLSRTKITDKDAKEGALVARVDSYIREALMPFVDRRIASDMDVEVRRADLEVIEARVVLYRGPHRAIDLRFENLWDLIRQG